MTICINNATKSILILPAFLFYGFTF
jgi:hypothetical protein